MRSTIIYYTMNFISNEVFSVNHLVGIGDGQNHQKDHMKFHQSTANPNKGTRIKMLVTSLENIKDQDRAPDIVDHHTVNHAEKHIKRPKTNVSQL